MGRSKVANRSFRSVRLRPIVQGLESRSLLTAGALDPNFGGGSGYFLAPVTPANGSGSFQATTIVTEADSSIIAGGISSQGIRLIHLTASGVLDTSFGNAGEVNVPFPSGLTSSGQVTVLRQADGQIIVTEPVASSSTSTVGDMLVARFNANGTADASFGTNGSVLVDPTTTFGLMNGQLGLATLQSNGGIILAGSSKSQGTTDRFTQTIAVRLNPNGSVDTSFGTNGLVTVFDFTPAEITSTGTLGGTETPVSLAVQPDGKILIECVLSFPNHDFTLSGDLEILDRLNTNGSRDSSLSQIQFSDFSMSGDNASQLIVQPNGQILLLGVQNYIQYGSSPMSSELTLYRFNSDGTLDTSINLSTMPEETSAGYLALQPNGDVVVATSDLTYNTELAENIYDTLVERFTPNLTLDASFGFKGKARIDIVGDNGKQVFPDGVAVDPENRIVVIGSNLDFEVPTSTSNPTDYAIARLKLEGRPAVPGDYTGDAISDLAVYLPASGSFAIRPSSGGSDEIIPFGIAGPGQTIPAPGDYTGAGLTEIAAYLPAYGVYAYRPANGGPDVTEAFGIPGAGQSIPAPGDYFGTGQDDIAVYMPSIASFGIRNPNGGPDEITPFGIAGAGQSIPAPGDYFGTAQDDIAVYLAAQGAFAIRNPAGGPDEIIPFGLPGLGKSIPIPGVYDNSGKTDLAVYIPSLGLFAYRPANGGPDVLTRFGSVNDGTLPVPGDYDGSGLTEVAIYDPNYASFAYRPAYGGPDVIASFGTPGLGATIPAATPAGALPQYNGASAASVRASSLSNVSTESLAEASPGSRRKALVGVNQGDADASKWLV